MKTFQIIRRHYATLGIPITSQQSTEKYPFNDRVCGGFLLIGYSIVSHLVYFFHMANGFMEHMVCICSLFGTLIVTVCFVALLFKRTLIFAIIDNLEKLIGTSKHNSQTLIFT